MKAVLMIHSSFIFLQADWQSSSSTAADFLAPVRPPGMGVQQRLAFSIPYI
jgi:hypothetical protein